MDLNTINKNLADSILKIEEMFPHFAQLQASSPIFKVDFGLLELPKVLVQLV